MKEEQLIADISAFRQEVKKYVNQDKPIPAKISEALKYALHSLNEVAFVLKWYQPK